MLASHGVRDDFDLTSAPLSSHPKSLVLSHSGNDELVHPYSFALFHSVEVHNNLGIYLVNIAPKTWHLKIEKNLLCGSFFFSVVSTRGSAGVLVSFQFFPLLYY